MVYLYGVIKLPGIVLGTLYLVYSYFEAKKSRDNVNHSAHFYGAVVGIVLGLSDGKSGASGNVSALPWVYVDSSGFTAGATGQW